MYESIGYLKEEYRLFYLCDRSEKTYDFHYHDFSKIIFFESGNVSYIIEGKTYELKPYDIVLVPKGEIHKPVISSDTDYARTVLYISQDYLKKEGLDKIFELSRKDHENVLRLPAKDNSKAFSLITESYKKASEGKEFSALSAKLLVTEALILLTESVENNGFSFDGGVKYDPKIIDACEYINNNLSKDLSIDQLSEKFFFSKYYFMRRFKEATGYSVHQYITEKRIIYTKKLIDSGEKVTKACLDAGFKDYSTYLRARKKLESAGTEEKD